MQNKASAGSALAPGSSSLQQAGQPEDELDRDFAADSPATKPGASDSDYSGVGGAYEDVSSPSEASYDDSQGEGRRKRRARQRSPPAKRPRVETHMTRKLRSNGETLDDGMQATSAEGSWGLAGQEARAAPSPTPEGPDDFDDGRSTSLTADRGSCECLHDQLMLVWVVHATCAQIRPVDPMRA